MRRSFVGIIAMAFVLSGCVGQRVYDPAVAEQPLPVSFFAGHVVSVEPALIGAPEGGIAISVDPRPTEIVGAHVRSGWQPGGGKASITAAGIDVGPEIESPAPAYAYTVATDTVPPQIVHIAQPVLQDDCRLTPNCVLSPGSPVAIRVIGNVARVLPRSSIPPQFQGVIARTALPIPLGVEAPVLSSPPHFPLCTGPAPVPPCYTVAATL